MLNGGKFNAFLQNGLWAKAANTAMLFENNLLTPNKNLGPFEQFFGKGKRSILFPMQKIGEMCITTYRDDTNQEKLANQGTSGIWVGYAESHPTGTCQAFNPKKKVCFDQGHNFSTEVIW